MNVQFNCYNYSTKITTFRKIIFELQRWVSSQSDSLAPLQFDPNFMQRLMRKIKKGIRK